METLQGSEDRWKSSTCSPFWAHHSLGTGPRQCETREMLWRSRRTTEVAYAMLGLRWSIAGDGNAGARHRANGGRNAIGRSWVPGTRSGPGTRASLQAERPRQLAQIRQIEIRRRLREPRALAGANQAGAHADGGGGGEI